MGSTRKLEISFGLPISRFLANFLSNACSVQAYLYGRFLYQVNWKIRSHHLFAGFKVSVICTSACFSLYRVYFALPIKKLSWLKSKRKSLQTTYFKGSIVALSDSSDDLTL